MHGLPRSLPAVLVATFIWAPAAHAHGAGDSPAVTHADTPGELGGPSAARAVRAQAAKPAATVSDTAASWCGNPSASDDLASAVNPGLPAVKLVYAFPADRPDRFRLLAGALQEATQMVTRFVASEAGGTKTIRFDSGTSCGPAYLDVMWVPLSRPRAGYLDNSGNPLFGEVKAEIESRISAPPAARNHLVFVDNLLRGASFGQAELRRGADQPGPGNANNRGGQFAFVWGSDGFDADRGKGYELPLLMLHEVAHTLGAVQLSAPHSTGAGHCGDGADVMCYSESNPNDRKITACADTGETLVQFDCNKDDYFNPAPAAGSYLATHWNVYDSAFLGSCQELAAFCGGGAPSSPSSQPQAARAAAARTRRATIRALRRGRPVGRRLGRMTVRVAGERASLTTTRLRLARGRWRLRSCLQFATASRKRCRTRTARGGRRVRAPAVRVTAPASASRVSARVDIRPLGRRTARAAARIGLRRPLVVPLG